MKKLLFAAALVSSMCAFAQEADVAAPDSSEKEDTGKCWIIPSVYFAGTFETASMGRSKIFENRPCFETDLDVSWSLGDFGNIGIYNWTTSSFTDRNQADYRRMFNEVDWGVYYNYDWKFKEGYHLSSQVMAYWMLYDGAHYCDVGHSDFEWMVSQTLGTPVVDVYYTLRIGVQDGSCGPYDHWIWANVGLKHGFEVYDKLTITPRMDFDLGNSDMYSIRNRGVRTSCSGLMAIRPSLRADYAICDNVSLFVKVTQFVTMDQKLRDAYSARCSGHNCARRDLTVFSCGVELMF